MPLQKNHASSLIGKTILITRPLSASEKLSQAIEAAGGETILFPTLEIIALPLSQELTQDLQQLEKFHFAIFISASAVKHGMILLEKVPTKQALQYIAIGQNTKNHLNQHGIQNVIVPTDTSDSESLLALPILQNVKDQRFLIFRAEKGREYLGETLQRRGAQITYIPCYRRSLPKISQKEITYLLEYWKKNRLHAVSIMSIESLHNLCTLIGQEGIAYLRDTPIFVPHPRIAKEAIHQELKHVYLAPFEPHALVDHLLEVLN